MSAFFSFFNTPTFIAAAWGFCVSFAACVLLVLTQRWHSHLSTDFTEGIQKFHTKPTPRIGGIPIALALFIAWSQAPAGVKDILASFLIAGLPAFIFGLAEDISKRVGVAQRLWATMASGLLAWWITDYSLQRVDVWGLDWLLQFTFFSVVFTAFAVGGVANAINIIDGFNGLASTTATLAFLGYSLMSYQLGDLQLASVSLILAACVWGFFWVNWPWGKIFLGDGGSYFVGFALAWVGVLMIDRNQSVSTFAVLIVCLHPVIEVIFSIYRRKIKRMHPGHPDRLHFHSLVKQRYVRRWFSHADITIRNSIAGLLIGFLTLPPLVIANMVYESKLLAIFSFGGLVMGYLIVYARIVRHRW